MKRDLPLLILVVLAFAAFIIMVAFLIAWWRTPDVHTTCCRQVTDQAWVHCERIGAR